MVEEIIDTRFQNLAGQASTDTTSTTSSTPISGDRLHHQERHGGDEVHLEGGSAGERALLIAAQDVVCTSRR